MNKIGHSITKYRKNNGWTKSYLAGILKVSSTAIGKWEKGLSHPKPAYCKHMAELFGISVNAFMTSNLDSYLMVTNIPLYSEVVAAAGNGIITSKEQITGYVDIPTSFLKESSSTKNIVCIVATGDSMEPVFYDGSILAIDIGFFSIRDGGIYLIRQSDMLRVKILYKLPYGLRLHSYNSSYVDELYEHEKSSDIHVVGRVVWYGVGLV